MEIRIKKRLLKDIGSFLLITLLLFWIALGAIFFSPSVLGLNVTNQSVIAKVNVTNTEPILYRVDVSPYPSIDLNAGSTRTVVCNGSFTDPNGYLDVVNVSARIYKEPFGSGSPDHNSTHYTNESCGTCDVIAGSGGANGTCACQFAVQYYAQNGSWFCNMSISDTANLNSSLNSSAFRVNEVLGIAVETYVLDYGNLSASQVSLPTRENVTNIGNVPINISVRGFGGDDEEIGQNFTMLCEAGANITFGNHRVSIRNDTAFDLMQNLTNQSRQILDLTIPKRTINKGLGNSSNATFWKLNIPFGAAGICNGTIVFGAIQAGSG